MAPEPRAVGRLDVTADLTLSVDGLTGTITGTNSDLTVETADPARLLAAVAQAQLPLGVGTVDGPRALGRLADRLRVEGVRVTVTGPAGDVLTMGDVPAAWAGRLVTGSTRVRMGRWAAVRPLVQAEVRRRVRPRPVAAVVVVVTAGLAVLRRRRSTGS